MGLQLLPLLLISGVLSAGQTDATRSTLVPAGLAEHQADLVLITVDALRADRLGTYGYARPTSPHIDALAREGIVFERAYCAGPSTAFSIASIMLGRHAWGMAQEAPLVARDPTLADRFARAGYETIALYPPAVYYSAGPEFEPLRARHFGFAKVVHDTPERDDAIARTEEAIRLLQEHAGDPVFLWVHYFAPHEPYEMHPSSGYPMGQSPSESERYDGEIAWVDRQIGRLVDHVRTTRPDAVIVLTSDHGEEFGEHGGAYHGTSLFDEQLRVPLLIAAPDLAAYREQRPVSTVSLGVMVESLFEVRSLAARGPEAPSLALPVPEGPVFAELGALKAVVVGPYKAICDFWAASCRLYDIAQDPGERLNLAPKRPRTLATMRSLLYTWAGQDPASEARAPWLPSKKEVALRRARRGDSTGGADLLALVTDRSLELETRLEAARFLSRVAQPRQLQALRKAWGLADPPVESWLALVLAGVGDKQARGRVAGLDMVSAPSHPEFAVQRAVLLAWTGDPGAVAAISETLARTTDPDFRCRLLAAVARLPGDEPRQILLPAYEDVRTRSCVAVALERRSDPQTASFVAAKLGSEPYATVRAALIRTLAKVGGERYRETIERVQATDREPVVLAAARSALRGLAPGSPPKPRRPGPGRGARL